VSRLHYYKEAQLKLTLCYVSLNTVTERQEKHMVSITFLFTCEGHEAIWGTWSTVIFLDIWSWGLCLSSLELSHKARHQITQARSGPVTFVSIPWSFLTGPDTKSHRQGLVLRPLSQFLGACSQGQMPNHTGTVPLLALTISTKLCQFFCIIYKYIVKVRY
jgi:hypothetical protein